MLVVEAAVGVLVPIVWESGGCILWTTTVEWKKKIQSFPSVRGPWSLSGGPYPGPRAQAITRPILSRPPPAREVPAPHPSTLKARRDHRERCSLLNSVTALCFFFKCWAVLCSSTFFILKSEQSLNCYKPWMETCKSPWNFESSLSDHFSFHEHPRIYKKEILWNTTCTSVWTDIIIK